MRKSQHPLPSVDQILRGSVGQVAIERFGRTATVAAVRAVLESSRKAITTGEAAAAPPREALAGIVAERAMTILEAEHAPRLRRVYNLTGTVLHTNLGRALLAEEAIQAASAAMRAPAALEFDLGEGRRGERDDIVRDLICALTGAEDAIVVNNNAAAVLLVLNTLAFGKESIVSRGELIEIGGSFRMPQIMAQAGTTLHEVGTTNRTHLHDYATAIGETTGLLLKVHTSNYLIQGFTREVATSELARLGKERGIAVVDDLGSGTLVDLGAYGLRPERTVREAVADGADLVTFSGDKLLGGPQAGFIVGRRDLVRKCAKNSMKRALRLDKVRLAALEATLALYRDPDTLAARLPTLRHLTRPLAEIRALAERLVAPVAKAVGDGFAVVPCACTSQIGSGALPLETIASAGVAITPAGRQQSGRRLEALSTALRALPVPVIGRIEKGALVLDVRCLEDADGFVTVLGGLVVPSSMGGAP